MEGEADWDANVELQPRNVGQVRSADYGHRNGSGGYAQPQNVRAVQSQPAQHYQPQRASMSQPHANVVQYQPQYNDVNTAPIHAELRQLNEDEVVILASGLHHAEALEVREQFFHRKMQLLMMLPPIEQAPYHPKLMYRMGTVRDNLGGNEEEEEYKPYFTVAMLILNIVMFAAAMEKNSWSFETLEDNPMIGPPSTVLQSLGAINGDLIRQGDWWRLFTGIFLHAGLIHLFVNMLVLVRLGWSMEISFGWFRVGVIYLSSGIFGAIMSALFLPQRLSVGASGALFGLIGALFGDFIQNHGVMRDGKWCYLFQLMFSSAIGLILGLYPLLDNFAHVGGWVGGILSGTTFLAYSVRLSSGKVHKSCYTAPLALGSLVLFVALYITAISALYSSSADEWCGWCENVSCWDTDWWSCDNCGAGGDDPC